MDNWQQIPINECGEQLISLRGIHPRIDASPQYFLQQIPGAINDCLVRQTVCTKLIEVAEHLPNSLHPVIWDGWRSREVQTHLFEAYRSRLIEEYPRLDPAELDKRTSKFISLPSTRPSAPSPHNTGGAVDLSLADSLGREIPMGTVFDDFSVMAGTDYFEKLATQRSLTQEEMAILQNRLILRNTMSQFEFANYPDEWWHFDYGNQWWARLFNSREAIYGPISI